jgi:zinc transporter 9
MATGSKKVVLAAITGNAVLTVLKFGAAVITQSAAMMNEAIHSLMDTLNQLFLLMGLKAGSRPADRRYAFGHGQKKYLWNLWSAIGLFSIGCGLGLAHAWHAWQRAAESPVTESIPFSVLGNMNPLWLSGVVLAVAFVVESWVFRLAWREFCVRARSKGYNRPMAYLNQIDDPTLVAVLLEDAMAVIGVLLAALGITLSQLTGAVVWDIGFSVVIALMLGLTAVFLGMINMRFLSDIRDRDAEQAFASVAGEHPEIERFHDVRSIVIDEQNTVLVGEIELREEAVFAGLHKRIERYHEALLLAVPADRRTEQHLVEELADRAAVKATLERTEQIIDEVESRLRDFCPRVSHVTLEVQGIASDAGSEPDISHQNR